MLIQVSWRSSRVGCLRGVAPDDSLESMRSRPGTTVVEDFFMPETGVEPARPYGHKHLKLARLPIPPPGRLSNGKCTASALGVKRPSTPEKLSCSPPLH